MKPRTLLILTVVTLVLGAFILFFERELPSTDERKERDAKVLPVDAEDVRAVTLRYGGTEVRLEKAFPDTDSAAEVPGDSVDDSDELPSLDAGAWHVVAPLEARAASGDVDSLVGRLVGLEKERTIDGADLETSGLTTPRVEVTLDTADGEHRLAIGADVPLGGGALVLVDGDQVMQAPVAEDLLDDMMRAPGNWRDRKLFHGLRSEIQSLALESAGGERIVLVRRGDGETFWLESPVHDRADRDRVGGLLGALASLEAERFLDGGPDDAFYGLSSPRGELEVTLRGREQPLRIEFGDRIRSETPAPMADLDATSDTLAARVDGQRVALAARAFVHALESPPDLWRARAWASMQVFRVDEATFEETGVDTGGPVTLVRDGTDWLRDGVKVPYTTASDVLYPPTEVRAERVISRDEATRLGARLDDGARTLRIELVGDDGKETLTLWQQLDAADGLWAATSADRDVVLLLPSDKVEELFAKLRALRDAPGEPASSADGIDDATDDAGDVAGDQE